MKAQSFIFIIVCSGIIACTQNEGKPIGNTKEGVVNGSKYKVMQAGQGAPVQLGNWLKINIAQFYNDSLLRSGPDYMPYDSTTSKESLEVFKNIKAGDSLEFKVHSDSAFKSNRPPFATTDGYLITRVKVEKIYSSEAALKEELSRNDSLQNQDSLQ